MHVLSKFASVIVVSLGVLLFAGVSFVSSLRAEEPQKLAPLEVKATPFGELGVKRATIFCRFWRVVTFRKAIRYVRVDELYPESPAVAAGVRPGDLIVALEGRPMADWSMSELRRFAETLEVGRIVTL